MNVHRIVWCMLFACAVAMALPRHASAQVTRADSLLLQDTVQADTVRRGVTPRGAMFRSMLIPGWGQAAVGSYRRGGVFFAVQGTSWYMLLKTLAKYNQSVEVEQRLTRIATDSLNHLMATDTAAARRLSDPNNFAAALSEFPGMIRARRYVNSRRQQRQDWITYTAFFTLIATVDAYVNAHLKDFPDEIITEARRDGSVGISLKVPLPVQFGGTRQGPPTAPVPAPRFPQW